MLGNELPVSTCLILTFQSGSGVGGYPFTVESPKVRKVIDDLGTFNGTNSTSQQ